MAESSTLTSHLERALGALALHGVEVVEPDAVCTYLSRHQDLLDVLMAIGRAVEPFGKKAQLSLELYCDPEIADEHLVLYVRQWPYDPGLVLQLEAVASSLDDLFAGRSAYVLLTTDFRPPR